MKIKQKGFLMITVILMTILSFSYMVMALNAEPGSQDDPIVTKNYVEQRNQQLKFYVEENIKKLQESIDKISNNGGNSGSGGQAAGGYEIVNVSQGQRLIAGASTEIILRAGIAKVIQSPSGGIADVTIGKDLKQNENVPLNHLLIVPRDDGRGANIIYDSVFMVKGSYHVE